MSRELTEQEKKQTILFENKEWLICVKCSSKGNLYTCIYYRGMHMGFVNIGDFKTQQMFYNFNVPFLVDLASQLKKDYYEKGDKK